MLTNLTGTFLQPAIFVQLGFANGTVYLWSGVGNSPTFNGQTWTGVGDLLELSNIEEGNDVNARGMTITISGLNPTLLTDCMQDFQLGLPAAVYLGLFSGGSLISSPICAFYGRMDKPTFSVSAQKATIVIGIESHLIDLNVAIDRRLTQQDQITNWPADQGMDFVSGIQNITVFWGGFPNAGKNL